MAPRPPGSRLNPHQSTFLDFLRIAAASAVCFHHYSSLQPGVQAFPNVGQEAVIVFFVLSGFIIMLTTTEGRGSVGDYSIKRASRIYSTLVPCLLLEVAFCVAARTIDPSAVQSFPWLDDVSASNALLAVTFINTTPLGDAAGFGGMPIWSLTWEVWYYVVFALVAVAQRRVLAGIVLLAVVLFLGLEPFLWMPSWIFGSLAATAFLRGRAGRGNARRRGTLFAAGGVLALLVAWSSGLRSALSVPASRLAGVGSEYLFPHSVGFLYFAIFGLAATAAIWGVLVLLDGRDGRPFEERTAARIQRIADGTFVLYLNHTSLMVLLYVVFGGWSVPYLVPALTAGILLSWGHRIERLRFPLRQRLMTFFGRRAPAAAP